MSPRPWAALLSTPTRPGRAAWLVTLLVLLALIPSGSAALSAGPNLTDSSISASQDSLGPGESLTLTVTLRNTGDAPATVDVAAPVPEEVSYVGGSATNGGQPDGGAIVWDDVAVGAGGQVALSYQVRAPATINTSKDVTALASIAGGAQRFIRATVFTLTPAGATAPPSLAGSAKTASQQTVAFGEKLTYTITLKNSGASEVTVDVSDPLPSRLDLVPGTITGGGSYNAAARTIVWSAVKVPANGQTALSFQATPNVRVIAPTLLTNTAYIRIGDVTFARSAPVLLVMLPLPPEPAIRGSYKLPSQRTLGPDEELTFTINIHNSSNLDVSASVRDPLPPELRYVPGSASNGGSFSGGVLTWSGLTVPAGGDLALSFKVRQASPVARPTLVVNTASITSGGVTIERRGPVVLLPQRIPEPGRPPTVESVQVEGGDTTTDRDVTLAIRATPDAVKMYIQEWELSPLNRPRWQVVRSSGWVPFQSSYPWRLGEQPGAHAIGVWVADAAGNVSQLTRRAVDIVNLVGPGSVEQGGVVPYLVYYSAGTNVSATLKTLSGDADLYVWEPAHGGKPDKSSTQTGTADDSVSFIAPVSGYYLFLVYGAQESQYVFTLTPGGGAGTSAAPAAAKPEVFTSEPLLSQAGVDPLDVAVAPFAPNAIFLPLVAR